MIDQLVIVTAFTSLAAAIPWAVTCIYLTLKFRAIKPTLLNQISETAPEKFRSRSLLMMESNASWLSASAAPYLWFGTLMMRFAWNIERKDIQKWKSDIKVIMGSSYLLYRVMAASLEMTLTSLPLCLLLVSFR